MLVGSIPCFELRARFGPCASVCGVEGRIRELPVQLRAAGIQFLREPGEQSEGAEYKRGSDAMPGGGVEGTLGPLGLRLDVGDEMYFNNGTHHNLTVKFRPYIRF
jgi:hypothetical protein